MFRSWDIVFVKFAEVITISDNKIKRKEGVIV